MTAYRRRGPEYPLLDGTKPRALLVGVDTGDVALPAEESLRELASLAESAGLEVADALIQSRRGPDPSTYVGRGKLDDIVEHVDQAAVTHVLFDDELSPAQVRNIQRAVHVGVLDRTQLILDIFAQRAQTSEGKLQVELAQLRYVLPRLTGIGAQLSRLGGGIGTRGPGETKLETDRRRIRRRIAYLRRAIDDVRRHRRLQRHGRQRGEFPVVALVGYTNAGKSTLLQAMTGTPVAGEDRLFATLDPLVRKAALPEGGDVLAVDTVGFIRKLPHDLVAAFRATLEEVVEADVLLHVVDAAHPHMEAQARAVFETLEALGVAGKPTVTAFNKVDRLASRETTALALDRTPHAVAVSARTGEGLPAVMAEIASVLPRARVRCRFQVPYADQRVIDLIHRHGRVLDVRYGEDGTRVDADVPREWAQRLRAYREAAASLQTPDHVQ